MGKFQRVCCPLARLSLSAMMMHGYMNGFGVLSHRILMEVIKPLEVASFATASAISFPRIPIIMTREPSQNDVIAFLFQLDKLDQKDQVILCVLGCDLIIIASSADKKSEKIMNFFLYSSARLRAVSPIEIIVKA